MKVASLNEHKRTQSHTLYWKRGILILHLNVNSWNGTLSQSVSCFSVTLVEFVFFTSFVCFGTYMCVFVNTFKSHTSVCSNLNWYVRVDVCTKYANVRIYLCICSAVSALIQIIAAKNLFLFFFKKMYNVSLLYSLIYRYGVEFSIFNIEQKTNKSNHGTAQTATFRNSRLVKYARFAAV